MYVTLMCDVPPSLFVFGIEDKQLIYTLYTLYTPAITAKQEIRSLFD